MISEPQMKSSSQQRIKSMVRKRSRKKGVGMKRKSNYVRLFCLAVAFWFGMQGRALAYLDMTTGSYFIQLLVSSILSGLLFIKLPWIKLKKFIVRVFGGEKAGGEC
jgi:hypothetical protein